MLRVLPFVATVTALRAGYTGGTLRRSAATLSAVRLASSPAASLVTVGSLVSVKYSLADAETGEPLPESVDVFDQGEVRLVVGSGGFIPGLHSSVEKIETLGQEHTFTLPPEEAFGKSDPNLGPIVVPHQQAPEGLMAGNLVQLSNGMKATVTKVDAAGVTIDANAPFAGRSLTLKATLTETPVMAGEALEMATVAAGCFWGIELAFQRRAGVLSTEVGYAQGEMEEPDYKTVCSGSTGHTEAVRVLYDPKEVSYAELCDLFWERLGESRYKLNQVGNDRGTQYRHGIYPHGDEQMAIAKRSLEAAVAAAGDQTVHTEIEPSNVFWRAEEYHRRARRRAEHAPKHARAQPRSSRGTALRAFPLGQIRCALTAHARFSSRRRRAISPKGRPERKEDGRGDDPLLWVSVQL